MEVSLNQDVTTDLDIEFSWLKELLAAHKSSGSISLVPPPPPECFSSHYGRFLQHTQLSTQERVILALALSAHLCPWLLEAFRNNPERPVSFGGVYGTRNYRGFMPTGETALFLLAGRNFEERMNIQRLFDSEHTFAKEDILHLSEVEPGEPALCGMLVVSRDFINYLVRGKKIAPAFGNQFPAKRITTEMTWSDLVLNPHTYAQINEMKLWIKHYETMRDELHLRKKLKPGYKMLMHGPPGTGKTLTACLLGKETGREVYRVDLSAVVSKYIGETEKNLAKVFDQAEHSGWILFFDEADALFGSRTKVDSSHDRYANQEVSYLLQRIEDYDGIVILCTNLKNNIDNAFLRRFQSIIHFPLPKADERLRLWQSSFGEKIRLSDDVDLRQVAQSYEVSGSNIANAVAHATLYALETEDRKITLKQLRESISRELAKEGRTF